MVTPVLKRSSRYEQQNAYGKQQQRVARPRQPVGAQAQMRVTNPHDFDHSREQSERDHSARAQCHGDNKRRDDSGRRIVNRKAAEYGARHDRHYGDVLGGTPPGGEPVASLLGRLADFLDERWVEGAGAIAAVTHEGVIRAAAVLLGLVPLEGFYRLLPPPGSALEVLAGANGCASRGREFLPRIPHE